MDLEAVQLLHPPKWCIVVETPLGDVCVPCNKRPNATQKRLANLILAAAEEADRLDQDELPPTNDAERIARGGRYHVVLTKQFVVARHATMAAAQADADCRRAGHAAIDSGRGYSE